MLGWHISVFKQQTNESLPATADSSEGVRLAVWQTGTDGLQWLNKLVNLRQAVDLGGDGYPCRYTAQAKDLLPRIIGGPPHAHKTWICGPTDIIEPGWEGKTTIERSAASKCTPDEWLLVVAWDES